MKKQFTLGLLCLFVVVSSGACTSLSMLDISHYKNDQSVLLDGEKVTLVTTENENYTGHIAKRNTDSVMLILPSGEKRIFSVEKISHFTSDNFSASKTAGLVLAVAGGLALVWIIVATVTVVSVIVALPLLILG